MKKILLTIVLLLTSMFILTGCFEKQEPIVGMWQSEYSGYTFTYFFNKNKTGKYTYGDTVLEFTYEVREDNKVAITYKGQSTPWITTYKIDGKTLSIVDSYGSEIKYERKEFV